MRRPAGYLALAVASGVAAWAVDRFATDLVVPETATAGSKVLSALQEHPDRVQFPVGRSR